MEFCSDRPLEGAASAQSDKTHLAGAAHVDIGVITFGKPRGSQARLVCVSYVGEVS